MILKEGFFKLVRKYRGILVMYVSCTLLQYFVLCYKIDSDIYLAKERTII